MSNARASSGSKEPVVYSLERTLVNDLLQVLIGTSHPFPSLSVAVEFDYRSGRVDMIAATGEGELIAFEAKLSRWRAAAHQAYRATAFAHFSYVVLPEAVAMQALRRAHEFEHRKIGLCSVSGNVFKVQIPAPHLAPFMPWLTTVALGHIEVEEKRKRLHGGEVCLRGQSPEFRWPEGGYDR